MSKYYFISNRRLREEILYPRIPRNRLTESGREDNKTPRICVSKSIIGCLQSTSTYETRKILYLYSCEVEDKFVIQPTERQVSDAKFTGEEWIISPAKFSLETILHISKENITEDYIKYIIKDKESLGFFHLELVQHI